MPDATDAPGTPNATDAAEASGTAGGTAPARWQPSAETDRDLESERALFAAGMDLELRLACRSEAAMRRELGGAARAFVHARAYHRLGFVRLADYARERLGVSARTLQGAAWLATRLDALPAVSTAYDRSELSWAATRAICKVAVAADEEQWLAVARGSTVATLDRLVARARQPAGVSADPEGDPGEIDGEPAVRWRQVCPSRVRALWRRALLLASRVAGESLAEWCAAELVAAEGASGRPRGMAMGDRVLLEAVRLAHRVCRGKADAPAESAAPRDETVAVDAASEVPLVASRASELRADVGMAAREPHADTPPMQASDAPGVRPGDVPPVPFVPSDPFALEARLAEAVRVLRTIEPRIGRLLRVVREQRLYRSLGYRAFEAYVRERLGIGVRKAWALLKLEQATLRSADFDRAYRDGRLSWIRALALLPVLDRTTASAWIARAESVTVRRLTDEVDWVLTARDALGPDVSLAPPPVDSPLPSPIPVTPADECRDLSPTARLHIRAHEEPAGPHDVGQRQNVLMPHAPVARTLEVVDAEIRFSGPASVVALLRDVLDAFAEPAQPRWTALECLLRHVITHWERTPRHPDPVFSRDGWRCTVPACSSRRNLHDHHIHFRSRGGDNRCDNRTTVCAAHHLRGLHDGTIRASGVAPHAIAWELGVRPGAPPFLAYVGDRLCQPDAAGDTSRREISPRLL